jgi:hypothetical protein
MPIRSSAVALACASRRLRRATHWGQLAWCAASACASASTTRTDASRSPQDYIDQQLISHRRGEPNVKTADGGMLYHAEFNAANPSPLRRPFELLKTYCEGDQGRFVPSGKPRASAASLAASVASGVPNGVAAMLADADSRGIFGKFRCESQQAVWTVSIEPSAFVPTDASGTWRLQLFVKAVWGGDLSLGGELPAAPASAAVSALPQPQAAAPVLPPPVVSPESIQLPADSPPVVSKQSSPLNPQPLGPAPQSEKLLADPRPFGIDMGSDSPEVFASKLRLDPKLKQRACSKGAATPPKAARSAANGGKLSELCWQHPAEAEAIAVHARFADLGSGPVLAEFEVRYPPSSFAWLERTLLNDWGPADVASASETSLTWSWLHTTVQLSHVDGGASRETLVRVTHKPTLDRSRLAAGKPGREQTGPLRVASPWQLQLGYEPAQLAQAKLEAAGFRIAASGCSDGGPHAQPVLTRVCPLHGGNMEGLRSASVTIVDIGDTRPRLAQLEYVFDKKVLEETVRELRAQYGEPIPTTADSLEWWTGPVGIAIVPTADTFTLRYFHGRLLQYFNNAAEKNRQASKAVQRQGL